MKRIGVVCILLLAFLGIADSAYIAQNEAKGTPLICNIESLSDCNTVVQSPYSEIFGISVADFGILFYTMLFVLAAFELVLFNEVLRRALQGFAAIGMLSSIYSVYVQTFIIDAYCIYCLASALITFVILIFASMIEPLRKNIAEETVTVPT